jgi:hypothetical protein
MTMSRKVIKDYFELLLYVLKENNLLDKAGYMDESNFHMNPGLETMIAEIGCTKGETISVIMCCNSEGCFLPPPCILKGKNKEPEREDSLPSESKVFMKGKSGCVYLFIYLFIYL